MYRALVISGAVLLIVSFIWGYLWLEVLRDPKNELQSFYSQHPTLHRTISVLNKAWLPFTLLGASLIAASLFYSGSSSA